MEVPTGFIDIARAEFLAIFLFDFGRYLMAASLVAGAVWLLRRTSWASRKIQSREATGADFRREFAAAVCTVLVYIVVAVPMVWAMRNGFMPHYRGEPSVLALAGYFAAIVLAHDAYFYWTHRAMHAPQLFRHFHRFHHRTITPTAWAAYSFAVPEAFLMALFMPLYLTVLPTPDPAVFTFLAVMILRNAMGHAGLELHARGWASHPLLKWISTTTHHDLHHAGSFNHNFGFYFTWWDKAMGTEHPDYVATFDRVTRRPAPPASAPDVGILPDDGLCRLHRPGLLVPGDTG